MPNNKRRIAQAVQLALLFGSTSFTSYATLAADADATSEQAVERIEVTGTRIKKTDIEGPSPLIVITTDDMKRAGNVTVQDALRDLTSNTGTVQPNEFSNGFTPNAEVNDLRGFGPGYTLTLINGRRLANYPAAYNSDTSVVNTGAIPVAAVERIEVLTSGASAIYGSDAVAGVINIILKKNVEDTTITAMYINPTEGAGDSYRLQGVTGRTFEKGNITAAFEYQKRDPITGKDRDWLDDYTDYPYGDNWPQRGALVLDYWAYYGLRPGDAYRDPGAATCAQNSEWTYDERPPYGKYCGIDDFGNNSLRNESEKFSVFLSGNYELSDSVTAFADIMYYDSESKNEGGALAFSAEILDEDNLVDVPAFGGLVPDWYLRQRYFTSNELGGTDTKFEESALSAVVGLKGVVFDDYDWEVSFSDSQYDYKSRQTWLKEEKVKEFYLGNELSYTTPVGTVAYDGRGTHDIYQPLSASDIAELTGKQGSDGDTETMMLSGNLSGPLFTLPAGDIMFAAVAEVVKEEYKLRPDERTLNQDGMGWYNLTGSTGKGDRTRWSIGFEFSIPVLENLEINPAIRYDKYDSDSSSESGQLTKQITAAYRPFDSLLIRGGWGEVYRAPDMHFIYTDSGYYTGAYDYVNCRQVYENDNGSAAGFDINDCDSDTFFAYRRGSQDLKDETGRSYNFGFVWEPAEQFNLTVDYYDIKIDDLVRTESASSLLKDEYFCTYGGGTISQSRCDYVADRITRNVNGQLGISTVAELNTSPVNRASYGQQGIDATANLGFDVFDGRLNFAVNYTHILDTIRKDSPDGEEEHIRDSMTNWEPRSKILATIGYSYGDFGITFSGRRIGSIPVWNPDPGKADFDRNPALWLYNLNTSYAFNNDKTIARLFVSNLTNEKGPNDGTFGFSEWPWYDYTVYPGLGIGREVGLEISHTF